MHLIFLLVSHSARLFTFNKQEKTSLFFAQVCRVKSSMKVTNINYLWTSHFVKVPIRPNGSIWTCYCSDYGNGSRCCFPNWQALNNWPFRPPNFGKLKTICFDDISSSFEKLMWPINMCHMSMFASTFSPLANVAVSTSLLSYEMYGDW